MKVESPENDYEDREAWLGSQLAEKIELQKDQGLERPRVLITDRDGTFSMYQGTPEELVQHDTATRELVEYVQQKNYALIVNTGGSIEMMEGGYKAGTLPLFDAAIVANGSDVYVAKHGAYVRDLEYARRLEEETGFVRQRVYDVAETYIQAHASQETPIAFQPRDSRANVDAWEAFENDAGAQPPELEKPEPMKMSLVVDGDESQVRRVMDELRSTLDQAGMEKIQVIQARDIYHEAPRFYIHLTPTNKAEAADRLIREMQDRFGDLAVAVAGDDRNDVEVVLGSGDAGIAVGNREPSLSEAIAAAPTEKETKHFKISNGRLVYQDPDRSRTVASSVRHALHGLELAERLIKNR